MNRLVRKLKTLNRTRLIALSLLFVFCAMTVPLPVLIPAQSQTSEKDRSEPFPCMNRPCGCRSAEQCWKKCCCFTNAQKVAWAKANRVKVPDYVVKAAESEEAAKAANSDQCELCTSRTSSASVGEELSSPASRSESCCSTSSKSCCGSQKKSCCDSVARPDATRADDAPRTKFVTGISAAECQGLSFLMTLLSVPFDNGAVTRIAESPVLSEPWTVTSERLSNLPAGPPSPPPKISPAA